MTVSVSTTVGGIVRAVWEDDLAQYKEFAADGVTVTLTRAYSQVENEQKAERATRTTLQNNGNTVRTQIETGIAALLTDVSDLNAVAGQAAPASLAVMWTRHQLLAAGLRRTDKAVIGLGRIITGALSTTDTGV